MFRRLTHPAAFFLHRLVVLTALLGAGSAPAAPIHVFLVGGQSNADGRATSAGLPTALLNPQPDVPYYYARDTSSNVGVPTNGGVLTTLRPDTSRTNNFGPEVTFGRSMADFYATTGESIALLKFAAGGTNLAVQWKAGGTATTANDGAVYQNFQGIVTNGLAALRAANPAATFTVSGMIWMQGESDATADRSPLYQANLAAFISDIRLTYGANLPFVIGELSSAQTGTETNGNTAAHRNAVRAAQVAVDAADPFAKLVNTDALALNADALHFSTAGQQALGTAFATQMKTLVVPEPAALPLTLLGSGLLLGGRRLGASPLGRR